MQAIKLRTLGKLMLLVWALACPNALSAPRVVTTLAPITDLVQRIGGQYIEVVGLVPEGANSHTFEPAPSSAKVLAEADLIIANGLGLEAPILKLAEKVKRPDTPIVRLGNRTLEPENWKYDFSFPRERGMPNPHLWPNIEHTMVYVDIIRDALVKLDASNKTAFWEYSKSLLTELEILDQTIFRCIDSIPKNNRQLVTYHDSFAYFGPRYGMQIIGAIQPADFAEPRPREVARIIDQLKKLNVPAIFGSEVFPSPVLRQIAKEAGVSFVDKLRDDDLPGEPGDQQHTFTNMMLINLKTITEALDGNLDCLKHQ